MNVIIPRKQHLYDDARKHFRDVAMKNLDWPEAVWEAWVSFEQLHGSVEQLEDCLDRINRARDQTNARRAKVRQAFVTNFTQTIHNDLFNRKLRRPLTRPCRSLLNSRPQMSPFMMSRCQVQLHPRMLKKTLLWM